VRVIVMREYGGPECLVPEAAALLLVGLTTYRALFLPGPACTGRVTTGPRGRWRCRHDGRLACLGSGCTVVVTSSSQDKVSRSQELGASAGVLYGDPSWPQAARELSPGGRGFDIVLDSIGTWQQSIDAMRPGGRLVVLGASRAEHANLDVRRFYFGQFDLLAPPPWGVPVTSRACSPCSTAVTFLPPSSTGRSPLDEAAAAHAYLETGAGFGKVVLETA
jgi:zinc-binding alcohol dehydrogenase/oxidoreductase